MTISDFQEFVTASFKRGGKLMFVPSFISILYYNEKLDDAKVNYIPLPFDFFNLPPDLLKERALQIINRLEKSKSLVDYEISIICSGTSGTISESEEGLSFLDELDPSLLPDTRQAVVFVFESKLVTKVVSIPIENGELVDTEKSESLLDKEFMVSGILRLIQPFN